MTNRLALHIDFETLSDAKLTKEESVGIYNYAVHPSTKALMLAWGFGYQDVRLWRIWAGDPMPDELRRALEDPNQILTAYNSTFERYILEHKFGIIIPASRFQDPQASARYLSLPASLEEVSAILGLPVDYAKDSEGKKLIQLFCQPHFSTKTQIKKGALEKFYYDETTHPVEWARFCQYCIQDVIAEREVGRRLELLQVYPLPGRERAIWLFDQCVNDRGIPVDMDFVNNAFELASRSKAEAKAQQEKLTGVENANSVQQMLAWLNKQGYLASNMKKEVVQAEYDTNAALTALAKKVLEARKSATSTTYKKLAAVKRQVCPDGRLRNQFIYMGSPRCGRWSGGGGIQFHNMARPEPLFEDEANVDSARWLIYHNQYDNIETSFGSVLLTVKNVIRTSFVAKPGNRLNVCDLNAIETRVGAWFAGCQSLLDVFTPRPGHPNGDDPYLSFAEKMTGIPYAKLYADMHSKDKLVKAIAKRHRQIAKPGVLSCIYRSGGGEIKYDEDGYPYKSGVWGYASGMGIEMTQQEAHEVVRMFRQAYPEIVKMWTLLEDAVRDVLAEGAIRVKRQLGPNGCVTIDKKIINQNGQDYNILRIQLPSGRYLHYMNARIEEREMPWRDKQGNAVYKWTLIYDTSDQKTKQWRETTSHGGKIFENIVQGIARDILADKLLELEEAGLPICLHVHDEGGAETPDTVWEPGLPSMIEIMSKPVLWASGLPLGADGFEGEYYHK